MKGVEIAMASYLSELNYLANPVTTHVQSAEQHNQDVNSLGLVAARKTEEAIQILHLMSASFLVALCQAVDLRHLEETMQAAVRRAVRQAARSTALLPVEKELLRVVDLQPVFSYIDDASPLMEKLRHALVAHALQNASVFDKIAPFEEELRHRLRTEVVWEADVSSTAILRCRTYPIYAFVRENLQTQLLSGTRPVAPGEVIERVFDAMCAGKHAAPLMDCVRGWSGGPGPF